MCRAIFDTPVMLRVTAGRMACCSLSPAVTRLLSMPMGTESPAGSQPSHTENTRRRRIASQKAGVLEISRHQPRISLSGLRPLHTPAATPSSSPSTPDIIQADRRRRRELDSRCQMTAATGCR